MATMAQAIRMALHYGEEHLGVQEIFGQDVGPPLGGVFTCSQGLKTAWNTPLDERGIVGMAIGLALAGQRPVAEIQFCDYIFNAIDLLKLAGNTLWSSNGDWKVPMVLMTPSGAGIHGSIYHSHSFESVMSHIQGWKMVMPSRPIDAYGLMLSAIADDNPVMYLPPKALMRRGGGPKIPGEPESTKELLSRIQAPPQGDESWRPDWPELEDYRVPFGKGRLVVTGDDVTVVTWGRLVSVCESAAKALEADGVSVEVIDLRSLWPYDWAMISESVRKTGRLAIVNEDTEISNFGEHIIRRSVEEHFYDLLARPRLVAGANVPGVGLAEPLEHASVPMQPEVEAALRALHAEVP